ncbi:unnamed protein product [Lactuca saligna]|uniref:Uncharacterized protein n=1 Tax=Lactuca saligna TaxID=75948 RepID=A0AA36DZX2_LACSI|nr:unnamed protein product [Lactuca saligna]
MEWKEMELKMSMGMKKKIDWKEMDNEMEWKEVDKDKGQGNKEENGEEEDGEGDEDGQGDGVERFAAKDAQENEEGGEGIEAIPVNDPV